MGPYAALNDPTRRGILKLLRAGSRPAGEIAAAFHQSKPTISHHLKVLERAGLVRSERRGTSIVYALQASVLHEIATELLELAAGLAHSGRNRNGASS
jgi:ArsR family transcriptional regulator, arsenate/arsenite/antimonite-responsive transcriptional repressor